jgi:LPXTG-motif cell wall-anchored protein
MMKTSAALAILVAASSSQAALITLGGDFAGTFGNGNLVALNSAGQRTFSQTLGDASVSGTVRFSNTFFDGVQATELTLTNFTYSSTSTQPRTLSVRIVQDYLLHGDMVSGTASHQANGNINYSAVGQVVTASITSQHESTALPTLFVNPNGVGIGSAPIAVPIARGQGPVTSLSVSGPLYTIDTTYTFVISAFGSSLSVVLPDSGVDTATLIPTPASAALLGLGGLLATRRRR